MNFFWLETKKPVVGSFPEKSVKNHWLQNPLAQNMCTWWFIPLSKWVIPLVITGLSRARFTYNWGYNPLTNWDEPPSRGFAVYALVASVVGSTGYLKFDSTRDSTHKTVGDIIDIDIPMLQIFVVFPMFVHLFHSFDWGAATFLFVFLYTFMIFYVYLCLLPYLFGSQMALHLIFSSLKSPFV